MGWGGRPREHLSTTRQLPSTGRSMVGRCSTTKVDFGLLTPNFPLFMNKQRRLLRALAPAPPPPTVARPAPSAFFFLEGEARMVDCGWGSAVRGEKFFFRRRGKVGLAPCYAKTRRQRRASRLLPEKGCEVARRASLRDVVGVVLAAHS